MMMMMYVGYMRYMSFAFDQMRTCVCFRYRTLKAFEVYLKKGARGTDYVFPSEMLVMMNVIVDFKNHHRYSEVEFLDTVQTEMKNFLMERVSAGSICLLLM